MKHRTCCFAGQRVIPEKKYENLKQYLEQEIVFLTEQGVRYFCVGGDLGFDTMAALSVLALRKKFPRIRLILVLPCKEQANAWREEAYLLMLDKTGSHT